MTKHNIKNVRKHKKKKQESAEVSAGKVSQSDVLGKILKVKPVVFDFFKI